MLLPCLGAGSGLVSWSSHASYSHATAMLLPCQGTGGGLVSRSSHASSPRLARHQATDVAVTVEDGKVWFGATAMAMAQEEF